jgi:CHAT domain-containing protein
MWLFERPPHAVALAAWLLCLGLGCRGNRSPTLERRLDGIERHFIAGELAQAAAAAQQSEPLLQGSPPALVERFHLEQAKIWLYQGRTAAAVKLLEDTAQTPASSDQSIVTRQTLLAMASDRMGDLPAAQRALHEAEQHSHDDADRQAFFMARGFVEMNHDALDEAEKSYQLSLAAGRRIGNRYAQAQALLNLGVVALREEHYEDALERFSEASQLAQSSGGKLAAEKAIGNVAFALYKLGDFKRALQNDEEAQRQAEQLGAMIDEAAWLNDAGLNQLRLGDLAGARRSYEQSYELSKKIGSDEEIADAQVALGYLALNTGDAAAAMQYAQAAKQIAMEHLDKSQIFRPALLQAKAVAKRNDPGKAREELMTLYRQIAAKPSAQWEVESALAQLAASTGQASDADRWFERAIASFDRQRSSFRSVDSRLPFLENGTDLYRGYMQQLIKEGRTDAALAVLDRSRAETLAEGLGLAGAQAKHSHATLRPAALAQRLRGTILVYCLGADTSYLWAISPAKTAFFRLPGRARILELVESHTNAILHANDLLTQNAARDQAPGRLLYDALLAPAQAVMQGQSRFFIVADEGMHGLNFETLLAPGERTHFWIEDATVTSAASLSLLEARSDARPAARKLLLIGDPVYAKDGPEKLANAANEVASVAGHFSADRRTVLRGAQATPGSYRSNEPTKFSYIHFVAHGVASEDNPLDSSLLLSAAPGSAESNKLYARDILNLHIQSELVTISACYGAGSRAYSGEGLVGLAWAFLRAGSHNVIASLWDISDASTPDLMGHLYDGLAQGAAPDVALRAAKLAMLHSDGVFRKPLYWGPFQLYSGA